MVRNEFALKFLSALILFLGILSQVAAKAQAAEFYEGKTLRILVGFSPGGGFDVYARLLARHIGKHIPGNPSVIVENMPGAGSVIATNFLYGRAKPDGLTIGILLGHVGISQILGVEGLQATYINFQWIGLMTGETTVMAIRANLPHASVTDLIKAGRPLLFGSTGRTGNDSMYPRAIHWSNGANLKVVAGYPGASETMLAIERKEVDGTARAYSSLEPFLRSGSVKPLFQSKPKRPELPGIPLFVDIAASAEAKQLLNLLDVAGILQRAFAAPPGTSEERMRTLRAAFEMALKDPSLVAEARAQRLEINFMSAEEVQRQWRAVSEIPRDLLQTYRRVLFED